MHDREDARALDLGPERRRFRNVDAGRDFGEHAGENAQLRRLVRGEHEREHGAQRIDDGLIRARFARRRRAEQRGAALALDVQREFVTEPRLAGARFARHEHHAPLAARRRLPRAAERCEFGLPTDERQFSWAVGDGVFEGAVDVVRRGRRREPARRRQLAFPAPARHRVRRGDAPRSSGMRRSRRWAGSPSCARTAISTRSASSRHGSVWSMRAMSCKAPVRSRSPRFRRTVTRRCSSWRLRRRSRSPSTQCYESLRENHRYTKRRDPRRRRGRALR